MPIRFLLMLLLAAVVVPAQGEFYVNGLTGLDAPSHGGSPQTPWKTIGHALANIPPQSSEHSAILYVEGNQVYSTTTNGEVFPLRPAFNVWIEGTFLYHGNMPVIAPPANGTAFEFAPAAFFFRNSVTFRYLVVEGGRYGMQMGSSPGFRHRPRVQDCTFRHQTVAAISLRPNATGGDDPRFFQNLFHNVPIGIEAVADGRNSRVAPDIDECVFRDCGIGVTVAATFGPSMTQAAVALGTVRSCQFERCQTGALIANTSSSGNFDVMLHHNRMVGCQIGLRSLSEPLVMQGSLPIDRLSIEDSVFLDCNSGMSIERPRSWDRTRRTELQIARTTARHCGTGLNMTSGVFNLLVATVEDLWVDHCNTGWRLQETSDPSGSYVTARRCRISDCGIGIDSILDNTEGSWLRLQSSIIARCSTAAIRHNGFPTNNFGLPARLLLDGVTIADSAIALAATRQFSLLEIANSAFGNNGQDLHLAPNIQPAIQHSCFQISGWPGQGNLNFTDPQLVRPFYKLASGSPCIDAGTSQSNSPATDYEGDPRSAISVASGQAIPDIGADESIYSGSARPYGTPGFGTFNVYPRITTASPEVRIGQSMTVQMTGAIMPTFLVTANFGLLTMSFTELGQAQPFELAPYGFAGSYLWNDASFSFPLQPVDAQGNASLTQTIPNASILAGLTFTHQWIALMPSVYGIASSEGLRVTIGR
jgi:hypothetical protein